MSNAGQRAAFEGFYADKASWDIGKPQGPLVAVADRVMSPILDAGCGTGENALFFASLGHRVTGIDFVVDAIRRARLKATERALSVDFLVKDALTLGELGERFASVIDCGLFHALSDVDRRRYVEGLSVVLVPGGRLFLMCCSDEEPGTLGPRRVSRQELHDAFANGWQLESIEPSRFDASSEATDVTLPEGRAWFAIVRRLG